MVEQVSVGGAAHWKPAEDARLLDLIERHSHWRVKQLRIDWAAVTELMGMPNSRRCRNRCRRRWFYLNPANKEAVEQLRRRSRQKRRLCGKATSRSGTPNDLDADSLMSALDGIDLDEFLGMPEVGNGTDGSLPVQLPCTAGLTLKTVACIPDPPTKTLAASFVFLPTNLGASFSTSLARETTAKTGGHRTQGVARSLLTKFDRAAAATV